MARQAASLRVEGRVQGVGYRWWAVQAARRLGLDGWVRNRADESVEILAIGEAQALRQLADACHEGPSGARVASVTVTPAEDDGSLGFEQRATL
ncbi:MAG TPA: acylphosphatase [Phenylobacterium sp.]|jgi:acylphosphatase|uniref:acylphosphatase n=1 Tax=Phenylobacterium sp. TaxID=1871053 RepID=UPI002B532E3A|nr:acylphosphatase [Phenylobacterium sp.]HXA39062.1 acylphosphatase [Phenylobacterium sp.]